MEYYSRDPGIAYHVSSLDRSQNGFGGGCKVRRLLLRVTNPKNYSFPSPEFLSASITRLQETHFLGNQVKF
ncbi:unnamed protein product [Notodromas monacha]|uniref:Uncharacterized protein n=1 Tax=Notodromas monacha TaxID=399045 RepID=A0A7R9G973_9CRUS|nr:unnamed protein product [Notodromas monacha]CAG0912544.1 unnamed protein product [Notodromas monacha]